MHCASVGTPIDQLKLRISNQVYLLANFKFLPTLPHLDIHLRYIQIGRRLADCNHPGCVVWWYVLKCWANFELSVYCRVDIVLNCCSVRNAFRRFRYTIPKFRKSNYIRSQLAHTQKYLPCVVISYALVKANLLPFIPIFRLCGKQYQYK